MRSSPVNPLGQEPWLVRNSLLCLAKRFQHLFGSRAHGDVLGEVHPADRPGRINEELCRARDIRAFWSCTTMKQIVSSNHFRLRIGQECVSVAKFLSLAPINIRRVHADRDDLNPTRFKLLKPLLKTPQLGVT
jgi:hypothetical protein